MKKINSKNKVVYRYFYSCVGEARTREPINFSKTKELGRFHFEFDFDVDYPKLISTKIIEADFYFEKSVLEDYLVNKYGKDLKYDYSASLVVCRCIKGSNGFDDVILEHDFEGSI